jgi:hypothetical protein
MILLNFLIYSEIYAIDQKTIDQYVSIIENEKNWEFNITIGKVSIDDSESLFQCVELLGAIRCGDERICTAMANKMDKPPSIFRNRFWRYFICIALIRIDAPAVNAIMTKLSQNPIQEIITLPIIMPYDSALALIQTYREQNKHDLKIVENMNKLEERITYAQKNYSREHYLPKLHDFTLNHPLYQARQTVIKTNIELAQRILKETKNLTSIDSETKTKLFAAVDELAKVRSVEAVETLTPILLLQTDKELENLDKKYFSLRKYPVGIALVKIGIPSIWGLLDEAAKRSESSGEYNKIACSVMSSILIKKAIPGFVYEKLIKYKDNELARIRLAKLLPLLDEDMTKIEIILKPQFRLWKSSDGFFETRAKFISIDKNNEITLEKENGKQTTIEFSALQKIDQDYVKEFITINKNKPL